MHIRDNGERLDRLIRPLDLWWISFTSKRVAILCLVAIIFILSFPLPRYTLFIYKKAKDTATYTYANGYHTKTTWKNNGATSATVVNQRMTEDSLGNVTQIKTGTGVWA
ncbi:MAG: hypothetical protein IJ845_01920 [Bacteroidaceae bacterium]|nr:hypothetical protein [Bacteroidaceae bacterium]